MDSLRRCLYLESRCKGRTRFCDYRIIKNVQNLIAPSPMRMPMAMRRHVRIWYGQNVAKNSSIIC